MTFTHSQLSGYECRFVVRLWDIIKHFAFYDASSAHIHLNVNLYQCMYNICTYVFNLRNCKWFQMKSLFAANFHCCTYKNKLLSRRRFFVVPIALYSKFALHTDACLCIHAYIHLNIYILHVLFNFLISLKYVNTTLLEHVHFICCTATLTNLFFVINYLNKTLVVLKLIYN